MSLNAVKIWLRDLWRNFERSWSEAAEMQMRIDEAKLRVSHTVFCHRLYEGENGQSQKYLRSK